MVPGPHYHTADARPSTSGTTPPPPSREPRVLELARAEPELGRVGGGGGGQKGKNTRWTTPPPPATSEGDAHQVEGGSSEP